MIRRGAVLLLASLATLWIPEIEGAPSFFRPDQRGDLFRNLPKRPEWRFVTKLWPQFNVHHPQGLVKVGERYYLSSVEVMTKTTGRGHLFEFDQEGFPLRKMTLGEGRLYHPGGIDFDGTWIWVPVAEYRPESATIIYKVHRTTWRAVEVFRVPDHIGAVVFNREFGTLIGLSWDSRYYYEWSLDGRRIRKAVNENRFIAYQDCKYVTGPAMLCSGTTDNARGGIDLVDLYDFGKIRSVSNIPRSPRRTLMTRNPMTVEEKEGGLRFYFLPEDRYAVLFIYDLR